MSSAKSPNVIIVMCDDLGYGDLSSHGHPYIQTPNLDAFRQSGVTLSNYHSSPVCTPSRSELMTGYSCDAHGGFFGAWSTFPPAHRLQNHAGILQRE